MATIEALIRKRLIGNAQLSEKLATFGAAPAIFFQEAPDDKDESWGDAQYPRIVFSADTFADPARDRRKVMFVDIACSTTGTPPEEIEPLVRDTLAGVFFTPDVGETFSAKWKETQVFKEAVGDREPLIVGMTVSLQCVAIQRNGARELLLSEERGCAAFLSRHESDLRSISVVGIRL